MAKSTRPTVRIHDIETNQVIDREMTDEEFVQYQAEELAAANEKAEIAAARALKVSAYEKLGLTTDEIAALIG